MEVLDINSIVMEIDQALDSQHFPGQDELHTEDTANTVAEVLCARRCT